MRISSLQLPSVLLLTGLALTAPLAADSETAPVKLVGFSSAEGQERLVRSRFKADFFRLANYFETQQNNGTCGPTSAVIVLNSLRTDNKNIEKPIDKAGYPANLRASLPPGMEPVSARYTQSTFLDARFEKVKSIATFYGAPGPDGKRDGGLQLRQLHEILQAYGLKSSLRVVDDAAKESDIRNELKQNLRSDGDFVIVNYARAGLGQPGGGHISPLAAYDAASDSFLVLDVSTYKAPWVWVQTKALVAAMRTLDTLENRGYLLVSEGTK